MLSFYPRFTFAPSITFQQLLAVLLDHWKAPSFFILDWYCIFCLSHSHLLAHQSAVAMKITVLSFHPVLRTPPPPVSCQSKLKSRVRWLLALHSRRLRVPDIVLTRCSRATAMAGLRISTGRPARVGDFPAVRQEVASALSPQSAVHLKVLHSSTSRFFH